MKSNTKNLPACTSCEIRGNALFGELEIKDLDSVRPLRSEQTNYEAGEYLYHEGDIPTKAYTVYEGWLILYKNLDNGERHILSFALVGDFLSFQTGRNIKYDHSAVAVSKVTLCTFPLNRFKKGITKLPDLAFAINTIIHKSTERCHSALTSIASHPAEAKVAFLLLSLFIRSTKNKKQTECIPFPITQEDISNTLGLTAIHVNRVFQSLRKQKLIHCKNKCLWIPDKIALAKVAKTDFHKLEASLLFI